MEAGVKAPFQLFHLLQTCINSDSTSLFLYITAGGGYVCKTLQQSVLNILLNAQLPFVLHVLLFLFAVRIQHKLTVSC